MTISTRIHSLLPTSKYGAFSYPQNTDLTVAGLVEATGHALLAPIHMLCISLQERERQRVWEQRMWFNLKAQRLFTLVAFSRTSFARVSVLGYKRSDQAKAYCVGRQLVNLTSFLPIPRFCKSRLLKSSVTTEKWLCEKRLQNPLTQEHDSHLRGLHLMEAIVLPRITIPTRGVTLHTFHQRAQLLPC